jgi:F-type H+-transporting ATPase subunit b
MTSFAKFRKLSATKLGVTKHALLLAAVVLISGFAVGQSSQSQPANSSESQVSSTPATGTSADQAKPGESKEASGDETTEFKHSWSVQWLSKKTRLSVDHAYWLAVVLNFILVVILVPQVPKLFGTSFPAMLRSRSATIQKSLEEARTASADANRRLAEIESRLQHLGEEISQMNATAESSAVAEDARIKAAAEEDARRIVESAQQDISAAARAARRELTAHAADLAVTLAGQQIKVDAHTDEALVRRFAKDLADNDLTGSGAGKKN